MTFITRFFLTLMLFSNALWAISSPSPWFNQTDNKTKILQVKFFISSTCPHCHKADDFFREIESQNPWFQVNRYVINEDKEALVYFNQLLDGSANFSVPSIFFCGSHWVGFTTAQTTGKELLRALNYCKVQLEKDGTLTANTVMMLKRWAIASQYDTSMIDKPTTPYYLAGLALIDAFNPCALFGLMAFFAMLFLQDSKKNQWLAGLLYLVGVGFVHYGQQAYAETFFQSLEWGRLPAALSGILIFYVVIRSRKTPTKPWLFILFSLLLALLIQSYQQTCIMNWSYLFEQWIHNQSFTPIQRAGYEFVYQLLYLLMPIGLLIVYTSLINQNRFATIKRRLTRLGFISTTILALLLIVYPAALSSMYLSVITWGGLVVFFYLKKGS